MSADEAPSFKDVVEGSIANAVASDHFAWPKTEPVARDWQDPEQNPYGAWYVKTNIRTSATGNLSGMQVAVKDNLLLAGVPLMNGASILEGYAPDMTTLCSAWMCSSCRQRR